MASYYSSGAGGGVADPTTGEDYYGASGDNGPNQDFYSANPTTAPANDTAGPADAAPDIGQQAAAMTSPALADQDFPDAQDIPSAPQTSPTIADDGAPQTSPLANPQNFGAAANVGANQQLANDLGYTGDFGGGGFDQWIQQQSPDVQESAANILNGAGEGNRVDFGAANGAPAPTPGQLSLVDVSPANPTGGFDTPYYQVTMNNGGLGAAIPSTLTDSQAVQIVDPTGKVIATGYGGSGAQQIATLANYVSKQLGDKAQYTIQYEQQPGQFVNAGGDFKDRLNPGHSLLNTLVKIGGPILGAALAGPLGFAPFLGAAAGGGLATAATGGNLEQSLLAALTSGAGNSLGGALGGALSGGPVSFAGSDALGSLLKGFGLNSLTGGGGDLISGTSAQNFLDSGDQFDSLLGAGVGAAGTAASTLTPALVNGVASLVPGLTAGAGGAVGSLAGGSTGAPHTLGGIQVTGQPTGSVPGVGSVTGTSIPAALENGGGDLTNTTPKITDPTKGTGLLTTKNLENLTGNVVGQTGADLGVYGLANLFGLGGQGGQEGATGGSDTAPATSTTPTSGAGSTGGGGVTTGGVTPGGVTGTGTGKPTQVANQNTNTSGPVVAAPRSALEQALNLAAPAPDDSGTPAATSNTDARVDVAPDIYPWANHSFVRGAA